MIEYKSNILLDSKIKRLIKYKPGDKQVNFLNKRFYSRGEHFYPSVTSILNYFPKNQYFYGWLKDVGHNADIIAAKAANEGTIVHNAMEYFLNHGTISWINEKGEARYSLGCWNMIMAFVEFYNTYKPKIIAIEYHIFSDIGKYAGTIDLVCGIEGEIWLIDLKTSNSLHTSMNLQLAAYIKAWNETHDNHIKRAGILWLKSKTRKLNKQKFQGDGWQLKELEDIDKYYKIFMYVYEIYKLENPNDQPSSKILPTILNKEE